MFRFLQKLKTSSADSNDKDKVFNKSDFRTVVVDVAHKRIKAPPGRIIGTTISLWNPLLIVRSSVCEITQNNCNDGGKPRDGSLMDLRMGPIDSMYECLTCEGKVSDCRGHHGHLNLALPVYHVSFIKPITQCLQSVCHACSALLLPADSPRMKKILAIRNGAKRLTELAKICETILNCPSCGQEQRIYIRQKMNIHCYLRKNKPLSSTTSGKKRGPPKRVEVKTPVVPQKIAGLEEFDNVSDGSNSSENESDNNESENKEELSSESEEDVALSSSSDDDNEQDEEKKEEGDNDEEKEERENLDYLGFSDSGSDHDSEEDKDELNLSKKDDDSGWQDDMDNADDDDHDLGDDDSDELAEDNESDVEATPSVKKRGRKPKNDVIINKEDENFDVKYMGSSAQIMSASLISKKERKGCGLSIPFLADDALKILEKIDPKDFFKLNFTDGLTKPSYMILTVLPIPPPKTRIVMGVNQLGKARIEQDAGRHLKSLVSTNNLLRTKWELYNQVCAGSLAKTTDVKDEVKKLRASIKQIYDKLIRAVALHIDKDASAITTTSAHGKVNIPSWIKRFIGKGGRIRGTLNAKRMNFCGRGVITPGVNQDVDEFGVPEMVSMSNCVTETVTKWNLADLQAAVNRGPNEIRGANSIILPSGEMIDLKFARSLRLRLKVGYKVRRHIRDGDWILYGRQPTLSKMSLKGAKVKVIKGNAFRINLCDSPSFNADCDGDEMGVYFPQTIEAMAEIEEFMRCHTMAMNSKDAAAVGAVQDTVLAGTLSTSRNIVHTKEEMMNLMTQRKYDLGAGWKVPPPAFMVRDASSNQWSEYWSGKQITSFMSPTHKCLKKISGWLPTLNHSPDISEKTAWEEVRKFVLSDGAVVVQDGRMILGKLTKNEIGCGRGGFIQSIFHDFGPEIMRRYVSDLQRVLCFWVSRHGFGLGPSDILTDEKTYQEISKVKYKVRKHLAEEFRHKSNVVTDAYVQEAMNRARNITGGLACRPQTGVYNRMSIIIASKAKASELNIAQSSAMVGQVKVGGKRPGRVMGGYRCSSHFAPDTCDPVDQGAVLEPFGEGLSMIGYGRHAVGAREGLVDTATKTASVGYMMHRFMRVSEDLMNCQDGTVRDPNSGIVSVRYGGDGFDSFSLETQSYPPLNMTQEAIYQHFGPKKDQCAEFSLIDLDDECDNIWNNVTDIRKFKISRTIAGMQINSSLKVPVNILRILKNAESCLTRVVNPTQVSRERQELIDWAIDNASGHRSKRDVEKSLLFFIAMVNYHLATRSIVEHWKLTKAGWETVVAEIKLRFLACRTPSGEMVGCLAGHSIGEPAQQMTLNTFHLAGVGASNMTGGISYLSELMRASYERKSPVVILKTIDGKLETAQKILQEIKLVTLNDILVEQMSGVFFDPKALQMGKSGSIFEMDQSIINSISPFMKMTEFEQYSQFVIRLEIDKMKLLSITKGKMTIDHVYWKIRELFSHTQLIFKSPLNAKRWIIRIHIKTSGAEFRNMLNNTSGRISKRERKLADAKEAAAQQSSTDTAKPRSKASKDDAIAKMNELEIITQFAKMIMGAKMSGIDGIKTATIVQDLDVSKSYPKWAPDKTEPIIEIICQPKKPSCFAQLLAIEGVNPNECTTNVVYDIQTIYGIHAASIAQASEYSKTYEENSSYVQDRHIQTVVDQTTKTGELVSVNRNGFHQDDRLGFWKKISFERIGGEIMDSAQQGKIDNLENIVSNVVVGAQPRVGTGSVVVYMDQGKFKVVMNESKSLNTSSKLKILPKLEPIDIQKIICSDTMDHSSAFDKSLVYRGSLNKDVSQTMYMNRKLRRENCRLVQPNYADILPLPVGVSETSSKDTTNNKDDLVLTKSTETFWSKLAHLNSLVGKSKTSNNHHGPSGKDMFKFVPLESRPMAIYPSLDFSFREIKKDNLPLRPLAVSWYKMLLERQPTKEYNNSKNAEIRESKKRVRKTEEDDNTNDDIKEPMAKRLKTRDSRQDADIPLDKILEKAKDNL